MKQAPGIHTIRFYVLIWVCISVVTLAYPESQDLLSRQGQTRSVIKEGPHYTGPYELHPKTQRILEKYQVVMSPGLKGAMPTAGSPVISAEENQDEKPSYRSIARLITAGAIVVLGLLQLNQQRRHRRQEFEETFEIDEVREQDDAAFSEDSSDSVDPRDTGAGVEFRPPFEKMPMPEQSSDDWSGLNTAPVAAPGEIHEIRSGDDLTVPQ